MAFREGYVGCPVAERCTQVVHAEAHHAVVPGWARHRYYMGATRVHNDPEEGQATDGRAGMKEKSALWTCPLLQSPS